MKMNKRTQRKRRRTTDRGFSVIELIIAMIILSVAMLGALAMITVGISRNGSVRMDTNSANIAQTVLEDIAAVQPTNNANLTINDCIQPQAINTTPGGATVVGAPNFPGQNAGDIDFTQDKAGVPAGYQMDYVACVNGVQITYDVRWRIDPVAAAGGSNWGKLVTVAALERSTVQAGAVRYSPPVTLRTVVGM
jgi:prepilin-type N-terminal cleavage/methylation domain-containing protein